MHLPLRSSVFLAFAAIADDARKDADNVAFLAALPLAEQAEWLARLRWLRLADRLSENELLEPEPARFTRFVADWRALERDGTIGGEHEGTLREIRWTWFDGSGRAKDAEAIACWNEYLSALADYARPDLVIPTIDAHDRMLARIGSLFGVFPYLRPSERAAILRFGALDQSMNNVRDLAEDAAHGVSYFPEDVLARFGIARAALLDGSAIGTAAHAAFMRHWLGVEIPRIRAQAAPFLEATDLHPSLVLMREASLARYERVSRVLSECGFDYMVFRNAYWLTSAATPERSSGSSSIY